MRNVRVLSVALDPPETADDRRQANLNAVVAAHDAAESYDPDFVCFPEIVLQERAGTDRDAASEVVVRRVELAEPVPGPATDAVGARGRTRLFRRPSHAGAGRRRGVQHRGARRPRWRGGGAVPEATAAYHRTRRGRDVRGRGGGVGHPVRPGRRRRLLRPDVPRRWDGTGPPARRPGVLPVPVRRGPTAAGLGVRLRLPRRQEHRELRRSRDATGNVATRTDDRFPSSWVDLGGGARAQFGFAAVNTDCATYTTATSQETVVRIQEEVGGAVTEMSLEGRIVVESGSSDVSIEDLEAAYDLERTVDYLDRTAAAGRASRSDAGDRGTE